MSKVYGIDLGTTYSCIACIDAYGQPDVIANDLGKRTTPSVVYFSEDKVSCTVGEIAKNGMVVDYEQTVSFIKREMGKDYTKPTHFPNGLTPTEISARILRKLVEDANNATDGEPSFDVVITCPAYFGTTAREQTKQAGEIAGLNVLRIINEPTAAAVAYGASVSDSREKYVLIYDLGGGTFDVSLIRVNGKNMEVIVTGGSAQLGGYDWDLCLGKELLAKYNRENGTFLKLDDNPELLNYFLLEAEKAKIILSGRTDCKVNIAPPGQGRSSRFQITRAEFDSLTKELLNQTLELTKNMLFEAEKSMGIRLSADTEVLLVGGSSRMPQVADILKHFFSDYGCKIRLRDPDECVAKGAAIVAQNAIAEEIEVTEEKNIELYDVTSKTYGMGCLDSISETEIIQNIIFRNMKLPVDAVHEFATIRDNQRTVKLFIFESDSTKEIIPEKDGVAIDSNHYLEGLPPGLPKGTDVAVHFTIDREGILTVTASTNGTKVTFPVEVKGVMKESQIRRAKNELSKTKFI